MPLWAPNCSRSRSPTSTRMAKSSSAPAASGTRWSAPIEVTRRAGSLFLLRRRPDADDRGKQLPQDAGRQSTERVHDHLRVAARAGQPEIGGKQALRPAAQYLPDDRDVTDDRIQHVSRPDGALHLQQIAVAIDPAICR